MSGNNYRIYNGIVAEDRALKSKHIKVYLRELNPFITGNISDNTKQERFTTDDVNGNKISGSVNTSNVIIADYFGFHTNRYHPPDVVKGEQVLVLQYADEDKYYWLSMGRDDNLRTTELVRVSVANDRKSGKKDLTEKNTYFVELDTKVMKRIRIITTKSDGEKFAYGFVIDAKNGFVQISDDDGNLISLESEARRIKLMNKDKSILNLDAENIFVLAPGNITIRADRELNISAKKINTKSTTTFTVQSTNLGIAESIVDINSNVDIRQNLHVTGDTIIDGHTTFGDGTSGCSSV